MTKNNEIVLSVSGSRRRATRKDFLIVYYTIKEIMPGKVVSGECPFGADKFSKISAKMLGIEYEGIEPDLPPKGYPYEQFRDAYYARDKIIAQKGDKLLALLAKTKGGTDKTIEYFLECNTKENLIIK